MTEWVARENFDGLALAAEAKLGRVGTRANFFAYLKEVWQRRSFAATFAWFQMNAQTARSSLGVAWIVIVPSLQILIYGLIFGFVLGSNKPDNYIPYLIVGVAFFQTLSNGITDGAQAIVSNQALVNSLDFPRALLPAAVVVANFLESLPILLLTLVALPFLGQPVTVEWLLLIPIFAIIVMFGAGLTFISARMAVFWPDFKLLLPFFSRVFFYISGIFWSINKLGEGNQWLVTILWANPMQLLISLARSVTVGGYDATSLEWILATAWAFAVFIFGLIFFWLAEEKYAQNG
ncbi:MAG: ABC transporter permease [Micrococcales bacterium]